MMSYEVVFLAAIIFYLCAIVVLSILYWFLPNFKKRQSYIFLSSFILLCPFLILFPSMITFENTPVTW